MLIPMYLPEVKFSYVFNLHQNETTRIMTAKYNLQC